MKNSNNNNNLSVDWNYTEHAKHYDKRADYSTIAICDLVKLTGCNTKSKIADIGAGTGKLTKELLKLKLNVQSVEPNEAMRAIGIANTQGSSVTWSAGTGEKTGLKENSVNAAFFGSSFNVVNQTDCLKEVCRILKLKGWFACMWNHRKLDDPIQYQIENIIKSYITNYSYGTRRQNPTKVINENNQFSSVKTIKKNFNWSMSKNDLIIAWKSHATLRRQSKSNVTFEHIINDIETYLDTIDDIIEVPYSTNIFVAQKIK